MNPEQEQLVADHIGYAHHLANIRNRSVPAIWRGDMHSAALEGLLKAAAGFDPGRGWKFVTYARWRINGEMSDQLRTLHNGRPSQTGTNWHSRDREMSLDALAEASSPHGRDPIPVSELPIMADHRADPASIVDRQETGWLCQDLLALLHWDERAIAEKYFLDGLNLAEIARLEGVTESRICQRMKAIRRRLRQLAVRAEIVAA